MLIFDTKRLRLLGKKWRNHLSEYPIPFVTEVLQMAGIVHFSKDIPEIYIMRAAARGKAVHLSCEMIDLNRECGTSDFQPYVDAYLDFKAQENFTPTLIEHEIRGESRGMRFVGRCDRTGILHGKETVLDIKTSSVPSKSWPIQTSAYALGLWGTGYSEIKSRAVVHLRKTGKYKLFIYDNPIDDLVWEEALTETYRQMMSGVKLPSEFRK